MFKKPVLYTENRPVELSWGELGHRETRDYVLLRRRALHTPTALVQRHVVEHLGCSAIALHVSKPPIKRSTLRSGVYC
jgi:hypothetical protein